jgi:two-component system, OmpR family, alkaline phosphatase synthesis response regulator PhoP
MKILVADDNQLLLAMTRDALAEAGFTVVTVDSGLEVYKKVLAEKPNLILLDIMMPGLDGIEICRNLKRSPVTKDIIIIFHSGKKDPALMDLCFEAGAESFLIKSNDFDHLVSRVKEVVSEKC